MVEEEVGVGGLGTRCLTIVSVSIFPMASGAIGVVDELLLAGVLGRIVPNYIV
jgi:hypothetical protein